MRTTGSSSMSAASATMSPARRGPWRRCRGSARSASSSPKCWCRRTPSAWSASPTRPSAPGSGSSTIVQGVGTRVALAVLSTLSTGELASAIALRRQGDGRPRPGVGPKLAQRIVSELKDKAPGLQLADPALATSRARSRRRRRAPPPMPSRRWSISAMARPRPVRRSAVRCRRRALTRQPRS